MHNSQQLTNGNKLKIQEMLGSGLTPAVVASATGVSESYISQLLSDTEFATRVTELRFQALDSYNKRDATYDEIEDKLLEKLKDVLPYMVKSGEILKSIQVINGAKRRGVDPITQGGAQASQTIVNLILPNHVVTNYTTNNIGQVVEATHQQPNGETTKQALITMPSTKIKQMLAPKQEIKQLE